MKDQVIQMPPVSHQDLLEQILDTGKGNSEKLDGLVVQVTTLSTKMEVLWDERSGRRQAKTSRGQTLFGVGVGACVTAIVDAVKLHFAHVK